MGYIRKFRGNLDKYDEEKKLFLEGGFKVQTIEFGATAKIIVSEQYEYTYSENTDPQLMTLCSVVKSNATKYINHNTVNDPGLQTVVHYNIPALVSNEGQYAQAIDINQCYWQIAYNNGYISEKTFKRGLYLDDNDSDEKQKKMRRLVAIGSLAKTKWIMDYDKNGQPNGKGWGEKSKTAILWNKINEEINRLYDELRAILGNDFLMWLTDCAYCTIDRATEVIEYFQNNGYDVKSEKVRIKKIKDGKLHWCRLEPNKKKKAIHLPVRELFANGIY